MADELGEPIRWEGYQLAEKRSWVVNAPGAQVTWGAQDKVRRVGEHFADSDQALRGALGPLRDGWQGNAAERAGGAMRSAATWSAGAGTAGQPSGKAVESYGSSFEGLRARIPEPSTLGVWDMAKQGAANALSSGLGTFVVQSDISNVVQQNVQHDHEANLALRAHEQTTRDTVGSFPALDNPSAVTAPGGGGSGGAGAGGGGRLGGLGAEVPTVAAAADVAPVGGAGVGSAGAVADPSAASSLGGAIVDPSTPAGRSGRNSPGSPPSPGPSSGGGGRGGSLRAPARSTPGGRAGSPAEPAAGRAGTAPASGRGSSASTPPWLAGAGGTGGRGNEREHRRRYWVPTDEAFDVMPPHVPPVLGEE